LRSQEQEDKRRGALRGVYQEAKEVKGE